MTTTKTPTGYFRCTAYMCQVPTYGYFCHKCGGETEFIKDKPCAYCDRDQADHAKDCPCYEAKAEVAK